MKYLLYITILVIAIQTNAQSQVPGYQGKRFFVEVGGTFFPGFGTLNAQNKGQNSFPDGEDNAAITLVDRYYISTNYVLSRRTVFKFGFDYSIAGLFTKKSNSSGDIDTKAFFHQIHMPDFNISVDIHTKKASSLAPIGFYWNLGLRIIPTTGVFVSQRTIYDSGGSTNSKINTDDIQPNLLLFGPSLKWGFRTVFANNFTFNFSLQSTLFLQSIFNTYANSVQDIYEDNVIELAQIRYSFGIELGIGILLF